MNDVCILCGGIDDDTRLGWTVCRGCFRIDDPVREWPSPWNTFARTVSVLMLAAAVIILAAALGQLNR